MEFGDADDGRLRIHAVNPVLCRETAAKDEVWAGYRFVVLSDGREELGLKMIDLGAGHSSSTETLCGGVVGALKSETLLNENTGAGYIERSWPPASRGSGAWPLSSLRQCFLDGSLTRLSDPDTILRRQTAEFVSKGDFGLASGDNADGTYCRAGAVNGAAIGPASAATGAASTEYRS